MQWVNSVEMPNIDEILRTQLINNKGSNKISSQYKIPISRPDISNTRASNIINTTQSLE